MIKTTNRELAAILECSKKLFSLEMDFEQAFAIADFFNKIKDYIQPIPKDPKDQKVFLDTARTVDLDKFDKQIFKGIKLTPYEAFCLAPFFE